jgi:large subunit ribosomal protein L6
MEEFEVKVPEGVNVQIEESQVVVTGPKGELRDKLHFENVKHELKDGTLTISMENPRTKQKALLGTTAALIRNMVEGVTNGYIYRLKIVFSHFPINVSVDGNKFVIKNFSGEKTPRHADILGDSKVKVDGQEVLVEGINLQEVSQTAANIEQATRMRKKDLRVFADGIYITSKGD